jgi:hypothetical protein
VLPRSARVGVAPLVALVLASCGGGDETTRPAAQAPSPREAEPADFPRPDGRTLAQLRQGLPQGPILAPSVALLEKGANRFGFGLFDQANRQVAQAPTALYVARAGGGRAEGPFWARSESLEVRPPFHSESTASDPDAAQSVYITQLTFDRPGSYEILGLVRLDGRLVAAESAQPRVKVVREGTAPAVGERPRRITTPTEQSVASIEQIDTRVPPDTMHELDFADVAGKRPVVIVFATPALCQSRVCGPVVDITEQIKAEHEGEDIAWIHMEVFVDNTVEKGYRPQLRQWKLPSEPWLFTVDRRGRIAARLEGAFSAAEVERAVDAAVRG